MPVVTDGRVVLSLVRGDDRLDEAKLAAVLGGMVPSGDGRGDQEHLRCRSGLDRPCGHLGRGRGGREPASGPVRRRRQRDRPPPAGRGSGPGLRGAVRRRPRDAGGRHLPELRRRAPAPDGDRGRAHLQARDLLLASRSAPPSSTRTARRSRWSWAATASGPGGRWRRSSSSATTSTGSSGRNRCRPYDVHVVVLPGVEEQGARVAGDTRGRRSDRSAGRPRPASRGEVRRRRPDRHPDPHHGRQEDTGGRRRGRPRQGHW